MAALLNDEAAIMGDVRTTVVVPLGDTSERGEDVHSGQRDGGPPHGRVFCRNGSQQPAEKLFFDSRQPLLGTQDFCFVGFDLRSDKALGVGKRLFTTVLRGNKMQVGLRYLDIVSEHLIIPYLERRDAGPLTLSALKL